MGVFPVILSGGSGTRLWPSSRTDRPKQFLDLVGQSSLFQQTVERVSGLPNVERLIVVTNILHAQLVSEQLDAIGQDADILIEPIGRNSSPAVAAAALHVAAIDENAILAVVPADHFIPDTITFLRDINQAALAAKCGGIVTLGIRPTAPSARYGYIRPDDCIGKISKVIEFIEKPNREKAAQLIDADCVWNSGNFIAEASILLGEFERYAPGILTQVGRALHNASIVPHGRLMSDAFSQAEKISFDHSIMENTETAMVLLSSLEWTDIGSWDSLHQVLSKDDDGNSSTGEAILLDSKNCMVKTNKETTTVLLGVEDIGVVVEKDAILVSALDRSQDVRRVVEVLTEKNCSAVHTDEAEFDLQKTSKDLIAWLENAALPLWWSAGYDHDNCFWRESLTDDCRPGGENRRARVQGRQTYVYGLAGKNGWFGPVDEIVCSGFEGIDQFHCEDTELQATLLDQKMNVLDDAVHLYDQTFVLLALSSYQLNFDCAHVRAAKLLSEIEARFCRQSDMPGFREAGGQAYQSNAHMHLFEAMLVWIERCRDERRCEGIWYGVAERIAELACDYLIDPAGGFIREYYTADWQPADGVHGAIIEPGHQFEWASLLVKWANICGDKNLLPIAKNLYKNGVAGIDRNAGVALDRLESTSATPCKQARLWVQAEWLKAALLVHGCCDDEDKGFYRTQIDAAHSALSKYLTKPVAGLWFDKLHIQDGLVREKVPASTLYHIATAIYQLKASAGLEESSTVIAS